MKLWLISQDENGGYDTFDSAIVAAETEDEARTINPYGTRFNADARDWGGGSFGYWASHPDRVAAKLIGEADPRLSPGVVLASFNAG